MVKSPSSVSMTRNTSSNELQNSEHKVNKFMKKIPHGAEASNILVGEVDFLEKTQSAFIRLSQSTIMGDLTEVPVPTRFDNCFSHKFCKNNKFFLSKDFCLFYWDHLVVNLIFMKLAELWLH